MGADERVGLSVAEMQAATSPAMTSLKAENKELTRLLERAKAAAGDVSVMMGDVLSAVQSAERVKLVSNNTGGKKKVETPSSHVIHLTDLHIGQTTKPEQVEEMGDFNYAIAIERMQLLGEKILDKTDVQRSGYNIEEAVILGTGDYISGDIHPELQFTNEFPAPVQAVKAGYMLGEFAMLMARHFKRVRMELITLDNHGRLTRKPQASDGGLNNWGYVSAAIAKEYCRNQPNVTVNVYAQPCKVIPVGPERYLSFHGHQMKGWAGKPYYGFDQRLLKEALKRMNMRDDVKFTKMIFGHFHDAVQSGWWTLGGSLSGTDANDHNQGRYAKPHLTSWFVHDKHGEFDFNKWLLA